MLVLYFGSFRPTKKHIEDVLGKVQPFPATKPPTVHPRPTSPATWASCVRWARRSASLGAPRWCRTGLRWERGGGARMVMKLRIWMEMWEIIFAALEYLWVRNELKRMGMVKLKGKRNACRPCGRSGSDACQVMMLKDLGPSWWFDYVFAFWVANSHVKGLNWYIISSYHHAPVRIAILWLQHCDAKDTQPQCRKSQVAIRASQSVMARIAFPSWKKTTQIALSLKQLLFQSLENVDWSFRVWPWLSRKNDLCDLSHDHIVLDISPNWSFETIQLAARHGESPGKIHPCLAGSTTHSAVATVQFSRDWAGIRGVVVFWEVLLTISSSFLGGSVNRMDHYHFILKSILLLL